MHLFSLIPNGNKFFEDWHCASFSYLSVLFAHLLHQTNSVIRLGVCCVFRLFSAWIARGFVRATKSEATKRVRGFRFLLYCIPNNRFTLLYWPACCCLVVYGWYDRLCFNLIHSISPSKLLLVCVLHTKLTWRHVNFNHLFLWDAILKLCIDIFLKFYFYCHLKNIVRFFCFFIGWTH